MLWQSSLISTHRIKSVPFTSFWGLNAASQPAVGFFKWTTRRKNESLSRWQWPLSVLRTVIGDPVKHDPLLWGHPLILRLCAVAEQMFRSTHENETSRTIRLTIQRLQKLQHESVSNTSKTFTWIQFLSVFALQNILQRPLSFSSRVFQDRTASLWSSLSWLDKVCRGEERHGFTDQTL